MNHSRFIQYATQVVSGILFDSALTYDYEHQLARKNSSILGRGCVFSYWIFHKSRDGIECGLWLIYYGAEIHFASKVTGSSNSSTSWHSQVMFQITWIDQTRIALLVNSMFRSA